jgi:hypothetical protein
MAYAVSVVLRGGSIVGGAVRSMDDSVSRLPRGAASFDSEVSGAVVFRRRRRRWPRRWRERARCIDEQRDFVDESAGVRDGAVNVSSVLFGACKVLCMRWWWYVVGGIAAVSDTIELNDGSILRRQLQSCGRSAGNQHWDGGQTRVVGTQIAEIKRQ